MQLAALLTNEPIDFLINNAGVGDHGSFATADPTQSISRVPGERAGVNRADSRVTAAHDRAKTGRNFEREFLRWISPATGHCGLRGHKSIRHQFFRSDPCRNARLRDYRDRALPGAGRYRIREVANRQERRGKAARRSHARAGRESGTALG